MDLLMKGPWHVQRSYIFTGLLTTLTVGCIADEINPRSPRNPIAHPSPELRLLEYAGTLCPEGTATFDANDGAASFITSTEQSGQQKCQLKVELTVPQGWRFEQPIFNTVGYALKEDDSTGSARVTTKYTLAGEEISAEHVIAAQPLSATGSESFVLVDKPELQTPKCEDPDQPSVLELGVEVAVDIPADHYLRVTALEWELDLGVPWARCDAPL